MAKPKSISFAEIVKGRHSYVTLTDDGLLLASELVMVVNGGSKNYANQVITHDTFSKWKKIQKCIMHSRLNPKNASCILD
jgi:hypothetical protein